MVIHTPTAKLEVLGTQLNVDSDSTSTVVNVNEGRVRVTRLVDGSVVDVPADPQREEEEGIARAVRETPDLGLPRRQLPGRVPGVRLAEQLVPHAVERGSGGAPVDGVGRTAVLGLDAPGGEDGGVLGAAA